MGERSVTTAQSTTAADWGVRIYRWSAFVALLAYLYLGGVRWSLRNPPPGTGVWATTQYLFDSMLALVTLGTGNPWYWLVTLLVVILYTPLWWSFVRPPQRV